LRFYFKIEAMNISFSPSFPIPNNAALVAFKEPRALAGLAAKPPVLFLPDEKAAERFFGFFTASIRNKHAAGVIQGRMPVFGLVRERETARPG
jgi:hypothetical protein